MNTFSLDIMLLFVLLLLIIPNIIASPFHNDPITSSETLATNTTHAFERRAAGLASGWQRGGCVKAKGPAVLSAIHETFKPNSPNLCIAYCTARHYAYAGVRNGNECWCDDFLGAAASMEDEKHCKSKCKGQKDEECGGRDATRWFSRDRDAPFKPSPAVGVDLPPTPKELNPWMDVSGSEWVHSDCRYDWPIPNSDKPAPLRPYAARMDGYS